MSSHSMTGLGKETIRLPSTSGDCSVFTSALAIDRLKQLRSRISRNIDTTIRKASSTLSSEFDRKFLSQICRPILNYRDLSYPQRTAENGETIRLAYCIHALNHVLVTRSRVTRHSAKLRSQKEEQRRLQHQRKVAGVREDVHDEPTVEFRDQGYARTRVVIVVPFRDSAYR